MSCVRFFFQYIEKKITSYASRRRYTYFFFAPLLMTPQDILLDIVAFIVSFLPLAIILPLKEAIVYYLLFFASVLMCGASTPPAHVPSVASSLEDDTEETKKRHAPPPPPPPPPPTSNHNRQSEEVSHDDDDDDDDDDNICVVCWNAPRSVVLVPCGHLCMCRTCSEQLKQCPTCRQEIQLRQRVFSA